MLRVLLVDNDSSFLEHMQGFPWLAHQCECIGVAQSGEQVAQISRQLTPHIVVMDVCLSGEDGVSLMRRIRASSDVSMAHALQVQRAHSRRGEYVPLNIPLRGGIETEETE